MRLPRLRSFLIMPGKVGFGQIQPFDRGREVGGVDCGGLRKSRLTSVVAFPGSADQDREGRIIGPERVRLSRRRTGPIDPLQAWPCIALNV